MDDWVTTSVNMCGRLTSTLSTHFNWFATSLRHLRPVSTYVMLTLVLILAYDKIGAPD